MNITKAILVKMRPIYIQICFQTKDLQFIYLKRETNIVISANHSQFKIMKYHVDDDYVSPFVTKLRLQLQLRLFAYDHGLII